ncbi:hypothetical protein E2986_10049 [Frieseomelitta varia]|uniref:Uncharacterized protein n=2 Tax=Frieseomelitta varia TaxID=561572 RepID=A0A833S077_9HYME|nr:hypothetical protein E2986_10049 [Frieseomelitta varia]
MNSLKMKRSPLNTPSGSREKQSYNWRSHDYKNRIGYGPGKSDGHQCHTPKTSPSQKHLGNDFIPLNISTPLPEHKRFSNNWNGYGGRNHHNSGSGGFKHYRNQYHSSPKSNFSNSYSPYKLSGKQFYGQKRVQRRDTRKQIDISSYVDMKAFLEDPWADLTKMLNESKETSENESSKLEQSSLSQVDVDSDSNAECKSVSNVDDSYSSSKSRNESFVDIKLRLDDTDVSNKSQTESSIDLKIDDMRCSQDSEDDGVCNNSSSISESIESESNVNDRALETNVVQALV